MTAEEPSIFQTLSPYMKTRLMMASAIIFRKSGWTNWTYGHEKIAGVILWNYEYSGQMKFKYSKLLRKYAYGRTQNYHLLKNIIDQKILIKQGNGYYTFSNEYQILIDQIFYQLKIIDKIGTPQEKTTNNQKQPKQT